MSCTLEPVIQSGDTGQQMPFLDSCQLIITYLSISMSTIKLNTDCICRGHLASQCPVITRKQPIRALTIVAM